MSERKNKQQLEMAFKRFEEAQSRYQLRLEEKVNKAKEESRKAKEAQFIQMMESQNKKLELDEKLLEYQERKKDIDKQTIEKLQHKKQKEEEVRRKKKEYDDEKMHRFMRSQKRREEVKKKVTKSVQKKKTNQFEILLDQSIQSSDLDYEKRQFKSLSPSLQPLESESIVYFKLQKSKVTQVEKKKKQKKQKTNIYLKAYRESSVQTRHHQMILIGLIRPQEIVTPTSPKAKPQQDENESNSNNVTPKKQHDEENFTFYRLCSICNVIVDDDTDDNTHLIQKQHKQTKQYYGLMGTQNDIIQIKGSKEEMTQNRFQSIRKRCQKIRQKIQQKSLQLENNINIYNYKEPAYSVNRQRIQKLSNELDRLMNNQIKDLYQIEMNMRDLLKLINLESDLINLRQMKFIQIVIEAYKKISSCHKNEYTQFLKIIGVATEIVYQFCSVYNNRTYLIVSNKVLPIIDFMYSFLASKPTKFIYSYQFVAQCFQIFSLLLKHRFQVDPLCDLNISEIQEDTLEYIYCSGLFNKMKFRFLSFEKDYINSEGKIPVALVKSVAFIESATNYQGFNTSNKSIFDEEQYKIPKSFFEHIKFVIKETELFGLIHLISQMIFGEGVCLTSNKLLPQTIISFLMAGIKTLNNIARLNLQIFQSIMNKPSNRQETHMIMQSLVRYCKSNIDQSQDLKDLLNEVILMIGYYCVLNNENQNTLVGPMKSISLLHNLSQMPSAFYVDKTLKSILFPTLICCMFKNPQNMGIVLNEMDKSYFIEILSQDNYIDQFQNEQSQGMMQRSPSISSTNSQNSVFPYSSAVYFKLNQRFPIQCFKEALKQLMEYDD